MARKAPPAGDPVPVKASFTLSEADITSQRAVPRSRLPGVLGAGAAQMAFGGGGGRAAPAADHDGPSDPARPARRTTQRQAPDADG